MNTKAALVLIILAVTVSGCLDAPEDPEATEPQSGEVVIEITDAGFDPETVTVTEGTTVTWETTRSQPGWPASDNHPTHTQYPTGYYDQSGSHGGSQACTGEGEQKGDAFDACERLEQGETYSFTFNEAGTWGYHDHLRSSNTGTVNVVE